MKRFLSQKTKMAMKQLQQRLSLRCIEHEKHFRLHLLWNLAQKSNKPVCDQQLYNVLLRQYPCDCIQHRLKTNINNNMLHENIIASDLCEFCEINKLLDSESRSNLLNLYDFISSSFFTFQDLTDKYHVNLDQYIEWCRTVSMKNFALHQQLSRETIDYDQIKVHHMPPRPLPRELLRTQKIIDEQISIGMERQRKVISRCILPATRKIADQEAPMLRPHITRTVSSHVPDSSSHCVSSEQLKLERAILIEQAEDLDNEEIVDTITLQHDLEELENKYRKLLEQKNTLQSQIAKKKHECISLAKVGITKVEEFNFNNTKLEIFRDIASKNKAQLSKLLEENRSIQAKLDMIATNKRSRRFARFNRM